MSNTGQIPNYICPLRGGGGYGRGIYFRVKHRLYFSLLNTISNKTKTQKGRPQVNAIEKLQKGKKKEIEQK